MKWNNTKTITFLTILILMLSISNLYAAESVEWEILRTLQLEESGIDVAISPDGRRIFVLTDQGKIIIYSSFAKVEAEIEVGKDVTQIRIGPQRDTLILNSNKNKAVQLISLSFIENINVEGSPFKGSKDAPVVIAVFSDFE